MPRYFIFIWSAIQLIHLLTFDWWAKEFDIAVRGLMMLLLLCMVRQNKILTAIAAGATLVLWFYKMPLIANHILVEWAIAWVVLGACLRDVSNPHQKSNISPLITKGLPFIYLLSAFQKMNSGFFDPASSAAFELFDWVRYPFRVEVNLDLLPLPYIVVSWELAIGVFLLFMKTRKLGMVLGLFFHFAMALTQHEGIVSFSFMAACYYLFYLPKDILSKIEAMLSEKGLRAFMLAPAAGLAVLLFSPPNIIRVAILTLTLVFLGAWVVLLIWKVSYRDEIRLKHRLDWILPILFAINALQPHIGGKTALAFDMFSNLRTEPGYANHLILQPVYWFDYQTRIAEITSSNIAPLGPPLIDPQKGKPAMIVEYGLFQYIERRMWSEYPNVIYTVGEEEFSLRGVPDLNYFEKKFVAFDLIPALPKGD